MIYNELRNNKSMFLIINEEWKEEKKQRSNLVRQLARASDARGSIWNISITDDDNDQLKRKNCRLVQCRDSKVHMASHEEKKTN